jgi:uncharacterized protein (TIGR02246 family)
MKRTYSSVITFSVVTASAFLTACQQAEQPADTTQIEAQIREAERNWNHAYARRDAAALSGMYADDAALANPDSDVASGKEAIAKQLEDVEKDPNFRLEFRSDRIQVAKSGDLAYSRGRYTMTVTDPRRNGPYTSKGNYLTVWQKQADGSWKAVEDIASTGAPPTLASGAQALPG